MAKVLKDQLDLALKAKIAAALKKAGKSERAVSMEVTGKPDTIRDMIRKGTTPRADTLVRLARAVGQPDTWLLTEMAPELSTTSDGLILVRVIGFAQAGPFMEVDEAGFEETPQWTATVADTDFPGVEPFALEIRGDSINLKCEEGGFAICLPFAETGLALRDASWYVVDRIRGSLRERTVKQARKGKGARWELHPRSSNPKWQPLTLPGSNDADEVKVFAVVRRFIGPRLPA